MVDVIHMSNMYADLRSQNDTGSRCRKVDSSGVSANRLRLRAPVCALADFSAFSACTCE